MDDVAEYERRFRRAGLPLLIEHYSATEDVFTRALPLLAVAFLFETFGAINLQWDSVLANVGAFLGGLLILLGAFGIINVLRDRRFVAVPSKVGVPELAAFVLFPGLLPIVFGGQIESSLVTAVGNVALLGLVYLVIGYGLLAILRWAGRRLLSELAASFTLLARAVPLLMIFALLLFFTQEMWQMFSTAPTAFILISAVLFLALGVLFLAVQLPAAVRGLERDTDMGGAPLRRGQRFNVGLVMFVSQAMQVLLVSVVIGAFFVVFGALLVNDHVRTMWINRPGTTIWQLTVLRHRVEITTELLRVSGAIAAFSGLYYAIAMLVDSAYRDQFLDEITNEMRDTFAARAAYLQVLRERPAPVSDDVRA